MRRLSLLVMFALAVPGFAYGYGKTEGLIPNTVVGPKLSLRLPVPAVGVELKTFERWGAWFEYGFVPEIGVDKYTFKFTNWSAGLKAYPFKGAFFVGAGVGQYDLTVTAKLTDSNGNPYTGKVSVNPTYIMPRLGWLWCWESGFFMSLDLSWKFPLGFDSNLAVPAGLPAGDLQDVKDNVDKYGKKGLPDLGLLQVGFFL